MMTLRLIWEAVQGIPGYFRENRDMFWVTVGIVGVFFIIRLIRVIRTAAAIPKLWLRLIYVPLELLGSLAVILAGVVFLRAGELAELKPELLNTQFFIELIAAGLVYAGFYLWVSWRKDKARDLRRQIGDWDSMDEREYSDELAEDGKSLFKGLLLSLLSLLGIFIGVGLVHKGPSVFGKTLGEWAFSVYAGWAVNAMVLTVSLVLELPLILLFGNASAQAQESLEKGIEKAVDKLDDKVFDKADDWAIRRKQKRRRAKEQKAAARKTAPKPAPAKTGKPRSRGWIWPAVILAGALGLCIWLWLSPAPEATRQPSLNGRTVEEIRAAAEAGDPASQGELGYLLLRGIGLDQDPAAALEWLTRAAEAEDPVAQRELGYAYYFGEGVEQDRTAARKWYQKAARQGDAAAQRELGQIYLSGEGAKQDYEKALKWFQKAADQGNALALRDLGFLYANGLGVKKSVKTAASWYQKAVEAGNTSAYRDLGWLYLHDSSKPYPKKVVRWYTEGAEAGDAECAYRLGRLYETGEAVEADPELAAQWYARASELGHADAEKALDRLNGTN